jgi:hypothetical protein
MEAPLCERRAEDPVRDVHRPRAQKLRVPLQDENDFVLSQCAHRVHLPPTRVGVDQDHRVAVANAVAINSDRKVSS